MTYQARTYLIYLSLALVVLLNFCVWQYSSGKLARWSNVPPAPSAVAASVAFLGDKEMAHRSLGITLQSFGNNTKQVMALKDYNYKNIGTWLNLADQLNPKSDYAPFLAAYYYSGTQEPKELGPIIDYLRKVGKYKKKENWRYLGQAVFLAHHKMKNFDLAMEIANEMAEIYTPDMPAWVLQMRAILASNMGEKEMAYNLMLDMLKNDAKNMDPAEINYMVDHICNRLLTPDKKATDPLCQKQ